MFWLHSSQHHKNRNPFFRAPGFTLIEMMVTISILGVLTALAAPSFTDLIDRWRVIETAESLQSTIYIARSEAIKRGGRIVIQKITNGTDGCTLSPTTQDWGCGWFVYVDTNGNGKWDAEANGKPGEEILMTTKTSPNTYVTRSTNGKNLKVSRWGQMDGTNSVGFTIKPVRQSSKVERGVCTSSGGRVRIIPDPPCI
ncbi:MAG: prepilin-type N-terminal cleavage/methylation domain-containing protein [Comamonadaceae bacterium]|nr:MAG: prepilin-type N-terminal cleavage/methylation domain-containing protein [Comamonadaceae bacterium]